MEKNIPKLRFPEFEGKWEVKKLGEVSIKIGDGLHGTPEYSEDSDIYFINGNNLIDGKIVINESTKKVAIESYMKNLKGLNENSLLISINGTIGNVSRYVNEKVMLGKSVGYYIFNEDCSFYFHLLRSNKVQNYFSSELTGSTIKNLSLKTLRETEVQIPSLPEQTKIANFLTSVDDKISQLKKKKELLEQYKKGVMQKIFSQEIRFKDENGNDYPEWEEKKLGEILLEHKTRNKNNQYEEVFSVAKNKGVINQIEHLGRSYASEDTSNYKVVLSNDLVYTKSPTSDFPFGIIKQNKLKRTGIVSVLYGVFTPINPKVGLILDYYFSSWKNTYNYLNPLVQKGAKNTMNIGNEDFLNGAELLIPSSILEQTKIANFLTTIDEKINHCSKQIEGMENWKKGLLQKMFV